MPRTSRSSKTVSAVNSSSSSSYDEEDYSTKKPKKRNSTGASKGRSNRGKGVSSTSTGRRRRVSGKKRNASRSKKSSSYLSSSESLEEQSLSSSSSSDSPEARRPSRQTKANSRGKKKSKISKKNSKLGKTSRRRRRRTKGSTFRKIKAKRRGSKKKLSKVASRSKNENGIVGDRLMNSISSQQTSLKTNASQDNDEGNSGVVLSLPIIPPPLPSTSELVYNTSVDDYGPEVEQSVVEPLVEVYAKSVDEPANDQLKVVESSETFLTDNVVVKVEKEDQVDKQPVLVFSTTVNSYSTATSVESHSGSVYSPSSSIKVTVKSSSLEDPVDQVVSGQEKQESPTTAVVPKTVLDLLDRVETNEEKEKEDQDEENGLDDLFSSRVANFKAFVSKVEADLCEASKDEVDNIKIDKSKQSLSSAEKLQEMLDRFSDCQSSSSEAEEEGTSEKEINSSEVLFPTLDQQEVNSNEAPNVGLNSFVDTNSLSLSVRSSD